MLTQTIAPVHVRSAGIFAAVARGIMWWPLIIWPPVVAAGKAAVVAAGAAVELDEPDELPPHAAVKIATAVRQAQRRTMLLSTSHLLKNSVGALAVRRVGAADLESLMSRA
jgi:hypothetical protein